jgi:aldehyde dehydrogenase
MLRTLATKKIGFAAKPIMAVSTMNMSTHKNLVARPAFKDKYDNYINGKFVPPANGKYFDNISPIDGKVFTKAARSDETDVNMAIDAAHKAQKTWGKTPAAQRR